MDCQYYDTNELKIIGAGGFGSVYLQPDGNVLKAIVSSDDCQNAENELNKQKKIYNAFLKLKQLEIQNNLVDLVKVWTTVSKPLISCRNEITIKNKKFACYFIMERLYGVPTSVMKDIDPSLTDNIDPGTVMENVMVQLSLNSELPSRLYGITYSKQKVGKSNPPRGYFINLEGKFLSDLKNYGFNLNIQQVKNIIGFIYGYIFYAANIIPIDIEITLGANKNNYTVNILDFGMTIDMTDYKKSITLPRNVQFKNILSSDLSKQDKIKELERLVLQDISLDLYCDIEDDEDCIIGWNTAKSIVKDPFINLKL